MKRSEWSDKELEDILRQMPKIQDHRNPRDIYQNLSIKKRKTKQWLYPTIAAAAAVLLLTILTPTLLGGIYSTFDKSSEEKSTLSKNASEKDVALQDSNNSSEEKSFAGTQLAKMSSTKTALYKDEIGNGSVLTYWIPDPQGQVLIPISTIANNNSQATWLTLYEENMGKLKESEWGLTEFYPFNAKLSLDEKSSTVLVDVPVNHPYAQGSTFETSFVNVISKDVSSNSNVKTIKFTTAGQPGIELGNFGRKEFLNPTDDKHHAYLFYYPENGNLPFLVPSQETYEDINTAVEAMKMDNITYGLKASLLTSLKVSDLAINGNSLVVSLEPTLMDDQDALLSFEALLLTAKEFGLETVFVKDSPIKTLGTFDLSKEIKVPVAPNYRNID